MVERKLPKLKTRVRFPSPAPCIIVFVKMRASSFVYKLFGVFGKKIATPSNLFFAFKIPKLTNLVTASSDVVEFIII